jgi:cytochrome c peroxidase
MASTRTLLLGVAFVAASSACRMSRAAHGHDVGASFPLVPVPGLDLLVPIPESNPLTRDVVALGERLFFDPELSASGAVSCASCHRPERAFSDSVPISPGVFGRTGQRNAPALVNRAYGRTFFWDGRAATLEEQVLHPIQDSVEMGQPLAALAERLRRSARYRAEFRRAFGRPAIDSTAVARALASYVRTIRSGNAPVDRWRDGDSSALSPDARRGFALFTGRANCVTCHVGPNFTDEEFHNTGVSARSDLRNGASDPGRAGVTGLPRNQGAFKTPTLRDVVLSAPYMHDGSMGTLEQVVAFYDSGGRANPMLDPEIKPLGLTKQERSDLVAFLRALTGRR